jgi:hypothetical protein
LVFCKHGILQSILKIAEQVFPLEEDIVSGKLTSWMPANRMRAKKGNDGSLKRSFHHGCPGVRLLKSHASRWISTFGRTFFGPVFRQLRETKWSCIVLDFGTFLALKPGSAFTPKDRKPLSCRCPHAAA